MAAPNSPVSAPKLLHINTFQSALPRRVAEPGQSRRIAVPGDGLPADALQSHFRMVLYYNKQRVQQQGDLQDEEPAWTLAAWMRESLSAALSDYPVLCGRLRKAGAGAGEGEGEGEGNSYLEIMFNDAGVRLVQATADISMAEFLGSEKKYEMEGHLAYWLDIDEKNPNLSPLFYIQVTHFHGGDYSIGISSSLLSADPLFLTQFLKSWAKTHNNMLAQGLLSNPPMFHLGYFQRLKGSIHLKSIKLESATIVVSNTVLFKLSGMSSCDVLASDNIQEVITSLMPKCSTSDILLMVNDHLRELRVESNLRRESNIDTGSVSVASWDELGMQDLALLEGNKPIHVSYGMVHPAKEGGLVVLMIPSYKDNNSKVLASVTMP